MTVRAELSSVATRLHELAERVDEITSGLAGHERDDLEPELLEVERNLRNAERRLQRVMER